MNSSIIDFQLKYSDSIRKELVLDRISGDIRFCDLSLLGETVTPKLAEFGLGLFISLEREHDETWIAAKLYHTSGEMRKTRIPVLSERSTYDPTSINHGIGMAIGCLLTIVETDICSNNYN